ncbi:hypothetical protein CYY_003730 [Polysphondylium violaceum]|uniref:Uncharacterized protein n=1 Tax=Polysphondylium violaceum TaxID=133409 RepID=A0A8J4PXZ4_9MYCE|nr:hypothetical protein CYY_003730 [Polysphondylium violaceum]
MERDIDQQGTVEVEITDIQEDENNNIPPLLPTIELVEENDSNQQQQQQQQQLEEDDQEEEGCFSDSNFQESDQFINEINQLYSYSELNILKKSDLSNQFYSNLLQFCNSYYPEILNQTKPMGITNDNRHSISSSGGSVVTATLLKPIVVKWNDLDVDIKNEYIQLCMEMLECSFKGNSVLYQKYLTRLRFIWYIAQGVRDEYDQSIALQLKYSKSNCKLLYDNQILPILLKSLVLCSKISNEQIVVKPPIQQQDSNNTNTPLRKHHHSHHQNNSNNNSKNNSLNIKINVKKSDPMMSILLDIIYLILVNNQENINIQSDIMGGGSDDDGDIESNTTTTLTSDSIVQVMIQLLCEFNEIEGNVYPIKKILLVFNKSIQIYFGSLESLKRRKQERLAKANYQHTFKSRTSDISNFIKSTSRYHHILRNNAQLHKVNSHFLGTSKEYKSFDLLHLPPSLSESLNLLESHLYPPEPVRKEIGVNYYNNSYDSNSKNNNSSNNSNNITKPRILLENPTNFERFYCMNVGNLSKIVIILLKIILAAAPIKSYTGPINLMAEIVIDAPSPGSSASLIETMQSAVDFLRHKEIISKSTLSILLLLLKHSKFNQHLQFEYITKILYESNAIVLLYKCLNLESIEKHLYSQNFIGSEEYFNISSPSSNASSITTTSSLSLSTSGASSQTQQQPIQENWRNYFSTICILRIIQKIIKHHPPRIYSLPLTKSANILKKYIQLDQLHQKPLIRYYSLKVMKSLVPYLNKKWKQNNMKAITDIYLYVPIHINDHWLTNQSQLSDHDQNIFESNIQERIEEYHKSNYELWYQYNHRHHQTYDIFYKTVIDGVTMTDNSSSASSTSIDKIPILLEMGPYEEILDFDNVKLSSEEKNRALSQDLDNLDQGESSIIFVQDSLEDNLLFEKWNIQKPLFSNTKHH